MLNILFGMRFLISREIVHLDLKPSNIVVCKQLIPKIMDFGEAYHRELCPKSTPAPIQTIVLALLSPMLPLKSMPSTSRV